jgi:hypothetical protein
MTRRAQRRTAISVKDLALAGPPKTFKRRRKISKPYGFGYEYLSRWWLVLESEWVQQFEWFKSKATRDKMMRAFETRHLKDWYYCNVQAVRIIEE